MAVWSVIVMAQEARAKSDTGQRVQKQGSCPLQPAKVLPLIKNENDLVRLKNMFDSLGEDEAVNLLGRLRNAIGVQPTTITNAMRALGELSPAQLANIKAIGRLDQVEEALKFGLESKKLAAYAKWLDDIKINPSTPIPYTKADLALIDSYLLGQGKKVEPNLLANEWVGNAADRQGDRYIDNVKTEMKRMMGGSSASAGTIKNQVGESIKRGGQAREFVLDARNTTLSEVEALNGIALAMKYSRGKIDSIKVILPDNRLIP